MTVPRLIFLAGPNGAGKSTFYETHLKTSGLYFVNADAIKLALGIPDAEASAAADAVRSELIEQRASFISETVFSNPVGAKLQFLREAIAAGYEVTLYFIGIAGPQLSEARVFQRVLEGGHDVPTESLARRYKQSLKNLADAIKFVPEVHVFDNSSIESPHRLVLTFRDGRLRYKATPFPDWLTSVL